MKNEFFRGLWVVAFREWMRLLRDRPRMISSVAMPLFFFGIIGAGFSRSIGTLAPGVDFVQFLFPGIIAQTVFMTSIFSGLSVVWDREFGFLKELLVAPISRFGIVCGKVIGGASLAVLQALAMMLLAPLVGVPLTAPLLARLIPLLVLVSVAVSSLGILIASRMRSQQGFQLLMQLLILPMIVLSGAFFPLGKVPEWLGALAMLNPFTYGVDSLRQAFLASLPMAQTGGAGSPLTLVVLGHAMTLWDDAIIVAAFGAALLAAALWAFTREQ